ncbi:MAG: DUF3369 domain-containing protein [Marinagarivorans sp.]|nr:DUF3369 domain-containing protein [Marinagarivorans sp.]
MRTLIRDFPPTAWVSAKTRVPDTLSGTGHVVDSSQTKRSSQVVPVDIQQHSCLAAREERRTLIDNDSFIGYFRTSNGSENMVYLKTRQRISELDTKLLQVFSRSAEMASLSTISSPQ